MVALYITLFKRESLWCNWTDTFFDSHSAHTKAFVARHRWKFLFGESLGLPFGYDLETRYFETALFNDFNVRRTYPVEWGLGRTFGRFVKWLLGRLNLGVHHRRIAYVCGIHVLLYSELVVSIWRAVRTARSRRLFGLLLAWICELALKLKAFENLRRCNFLYVWRCRAFAVWIGSVYQVSVPMLLDEKICCARQMVMQHAHQWTEHFAWHILINLRVLLKSDLALRCKDLLNKLVDLLLVLFAALEGDHARVVKTLTAFAVVRADFYLWIKFILWLEWHIAKHDADIFLCDKTIVVEVEP